MICLKANNQEVVNDPELIVFDKDGTLIDIHHYWVSMIKLRANEIVRQYFSQANNTKEIYDDLISSMGVDTSGEKLKPDGPVGVKPRPFIVGVARDVINKYEVKLSSDEVEDLFKKVDQESLEKLSEILKLLPGVKDFLVSLKEKNIKLAIATTDLTSRASKAISALGLADYFAIIVGADLVENTKPSGEMGELILNKTGLTPEKVVMVGDHDVDMKMALNSGIPHRIGVCTGLGNQEKLGESATQVIDSFLRLELVNE